MSQPRLTADGLARVSELFDRAVDLPPESVAAFLASIADPADRASVERLLAADRQWPDVEPVLLADVEALIDDAAVAPPAGIGPYRIVRRIARGGMGQVFEAERATPVRRRVALKLLPRGLNSEDAAARFRNEIRAMARMDHPHIAKVFDAGVTDDGRPWFVMELVSGAPLLEFCEKRPHDLRVRLRLFLRICRAVQHAHQRGVVHRDLKSSNILIDEVEAGPVPKIIDFGIAKAVDTEEFGEVAATDVGSPVGTAHYMSPEQVRGGTPADTRTDVYALGVILYRLLAGSLPVERWRGESPVREEVLRRIREVEPDRPSARVRQYGLPPGLTGADRSGYLRILQNDLDWVVLRAIEKQPERRYDSAAELAAEVERFLEDRPLLTGRPTATYRLRKFALRHRVGAVAAASALLIILVGTGGLVLGLRASLRAERDATMRLFDTLIAGVMAGGPTGIGQHERFVAAVEQAARLRQRLPADPGAERKLRNAAILALTSAELRSIRQWTGFPDGSRGLAFDRRLTVYARGDETGRVSIRDVQSDREILSLDGDGVSVWALEFSPDGSHLLAAYTEVGVAVSPPMTLRLWRVDDGALVTTIRGATIRKGAFDASSQRFIASHADSSIVIHRTVDGAIVRRLPAPVADAAPAAMFAGGPERIAVWIPGGSHFTILDTSTEAPALEWAKPGEAVFMVAGDADGRFVIAGGTDRAYLFDLAVQGPPLELTGHRARVDDAAFFDQGALVFTHGWDDRLRVWDTAGGWPMLDLPGDLVEVDPAGRRFVTRVGSTVEIVEWRHGALLRSFVGHSPAWPAPTTVSHDPDGRQVATAGQEGVRLWDISAAAEVRRLSGAGVSAALFDPAGELIVASPLGVIALRAEQAQTSDQVAAGRPLPLPDSFDPRWIDADAGGGRIAAVDRLSGRSVIVDRAGRRAPVRIDSHPNTLWIELDPENRYAVTAPWNGSGVVAWDAVTGDSIGTIVGTHLATRARIDLSPDGEWLAGYLDRPQQICVWRTASWQAERCRRLEHSAARPGRIAFGPGLGIIAVADPSFGQVHLLDQTSLEEVAAIDVQTAGPITAMAFSPSGSRLAITDAAGRLHVLDVAGLRVRLGRMGLEIDPRGHR